MGRGIKKGSGKGSSTLVVSKDGKEMGEKSSRRGPSLGDLMPCMLIEVIPSKHGGGIKISRHCFREGQKEDQMSSQPAMTHTHRQQILEQRWANGSSRWGHASVPDVEGLVLHAKEMHLISWVVGCQGRCRMFYDRKEHINSSDKTQQRQARVHLHAHVSTSSQISR